MSWSTRSILPVHANTLKPAISNNVKNEVLLQKQKEKPYYDQTTKSLSPIEKGEVIRVWDKGTWNEARVENIAGTPESSTITGENERTYRRNWHI